MVRLADTRSARFQYQAQSDGKDFTDAQQRMALTEIRDLYQDARRLRHYTERWHGELAAKLGVAQFWLKDWQEEAAEFRASLDQIKMMREVPRDAAIRKEIDELRQFMEKQLMTPMLKQP